MLNLTYIKYLLAIQKYGSITQASKNLFVTQPNISKAVKYLETDLNRQLLSRSRNGCSFTSEGLKFIEEIKPVIESLENIYEHYQKVESEPNAPSLYLLPSSLIENIIIDTLTEQNIELLSHQCPLLELITKLNSDNNAYAFIYYPNSSEDIIKTLLNKHNIKSHLIAKDKMYLLTSVQNTISNNDVSHMTYVFYQNLVEDSEIYFEMPLIKKFIQRTNIIQITDRISEYKVLSKVPNTVSLSIRQPKETLLMYGLKLMPLPDEEVCFVILHKNQISMDLPEEIMVIIKKLEAVLKQ